MKKILILLGFAGTMMFASCGDDTPSVTCSYDNLNAAINTAIDDLNAAITAFNNENSEENCQAIRDAANDYIDAIEEFDGCAEIAVADYEEALQAARDAADSIVC